MLSKGYTVNLPILLRIWNILECLKYFLLFSEERDIIATQVSEIRVAITVISVTRRPEAFVPLGAFIIYRFRKKPHNPIVRQCEVIANEIHGSCVRGFCVCLPVFYNHERPLLGKAPSPQRRKGLRHIKKITTLS